MSRSGLLLLVLVPALAGCSAAGGGEVLKSARQRNTMPQVSRPDVEKLVGGNTSFAVDVYKELAKEADNLFVSPYSLSVGLAMTYAGARGETEREMAEVLHFVLPQDPVHPAFNLLNAELSPPDARSTSARAFRLHIVNALWGQTGFGFSPDFLDLLAENYDAGMRLLDFVAAPETCRAEINAWVRRETEGKIDELLPERSITQWVVLVLTNAVYFKADWRHKFDERHTREGEFSLLDGSRVSVDMMHQTNRFKYAQGEGYQALELPYEGGEVSMVILLPDEGRFSEYERALEAEQVAAILADFQREACGEASVGLTMPKLRYESTLKLKQTLSAMGMQTAFDPLNADFSGMHTGADQIWIDDVYHEALVIVDEGGTEAAAGTAVVMQRGLDRGAIEVNIDRPFMFLIRDVEKGSILFMGRVVDPRE